MAPPQGSAASSSQPSSQSPVKDWVTRVTTEHKIDLQKRIIVFLLRAYGFLLAVSILIFILQGFSLWGFRLSETDLKFIGSATIAEIGGLLTITFREVFSKKK
jgi:hypothetical protein